MADETPAQRTDTPARSEHSGPSNSGHSGSGYSGHSSGPRPGGPGGGRPTGPGGPGGGGRKFFRRKKVCKFCTEKIDAIPDLPGVRYPEGVGFAVHVEAGYLGQHHPRVEFFWVGLTGKHLDVMPEFDQAPAQIPNVNPLATAMRLAAIGQQRNPHTHA